MKRWTHVAPGIYRETRTGRFYERPWLDGIRKWRRLRAPNLKLAKEELAVHRTDQGRAALGLTKDPYARRVPKIGELLDAWRTSGYPKRNLQPRTASQQASQAWFVDRLLTWWSDRPADTIRQRHLADYAAHRRGQTKRHGGRSIDLELAALSTALAWGVATGRLEANPMDNLSRPRFRRPTVSHCRDHMPRDADELHGLAGWLFETPSSQVLGWQLLLEAFTGARTSEIIRLRWDAAHRGDPGLIEGDWLWLQRSKGGVNPFAQVHPVLRECIAALRRWHAVRYPRSPWWLPGKLGGRHPVDSLSLTRALTRAAAVVCPGRRLTSHGLRAFYVTVRRSQGISDGQVAAEIGDRTGPAIIASTYGQIPPNWQGGQGLAWLPPGKAEPAWVAQSAALYAPARPGSKLVD